MLKKKNWTLSWNKMSSVKWWKQIKESGETKLIKFIDAFRLWTLLLDQPALFIVLNPQIMSKEFSFSFKMFP